jgi:hypothetical protein
LISYLSVKNKAWLALILTGLFVFLSIVMSFGFVRKITIMKCQFEIAKEPRFFRLDNQFVTMKISERKLGEWKQFCTNFDAEFLDNALLCRYPSSDGLILNLLLDFEVGAYYISTQERRNDGSVVGTKYGACEKLDVNTR